LNTKKVTISDVWNPGPGLGQANKSGEVKPVNEIPTCTDSLPLKRRYTITRMNDNINMDSIISGSMNARS